MLVDAALRGHVVAIGHCSGVFHQAPLNPDGTKSKDLIEPPPQAELGPDYSWESREGCTEGVAHVQCESAHEFHGDGTGNDTTVAFSTDLSHGETFSEAGRRQTELARCSAFAQNRQRKKTVDDEHSQAGNRVVVARQSSSHSRICYSIPNGNVKASLIPETINDKAQDDDDGSLTPDAARNFETCVGEAVYICHHRPDIQHSVNTLSRSMRHPTTIKTAKAQEAYPARFVVIHMQNH